MSATAERLNPRTGIWELVSASSLGEADRNSCFRCASCKAPAILVIRSEYDNYFRSDGHSVDCPVAMGHKIIRLTTRTQIDLDAILNYVDSDPGRCSEDPPEHLPDDTVNDDPPDDPDSDTRLDTDATYTIRSVSGMFRELSTKMGSSPMDDFTARDVNSIFLRSDTLQSMKANWGLPVKLVVTKRCFPSRLQIPVPNGYVILRDAYSRNDEDAIYFVVKMAHPAHNEKFKRQIFGMPVVNPLDMAGEKKRVGKDPHRNIAILANWQRVPHSHYQIYRADLNSKMVAFVNAPDVFWA